MPQARRSGSSPSATSRPKAKPAGAKANPASPGAAEPKPSARPADARFDAAAQRIRKLNERIIEAGKDAGDTTLTSYEKALKAMASAIERGAGSTDIDWISNLATTQAKFIRDVTEAWTSAARGMLK
jgi:hypothetical protein